MLIHRYLRRQILAPLIAICVLLVVIFAGYSATRYLPDAVNGLLTGKTVLALVFLKAIVALEVLIPVTLFFSVITVLGRMHSESEIIALRACGFGQRVIIASVLRVAFVIAILVATLSLYARPWAYEKSYWLKADAEANFDFSRLRPGRFHEIGENRYIVFLEALDARQERAEGVFILQRNASLCKVTRAREAWQEIDPLTAEKSIVLRDGYQYEVTEAGGMKKLLQFQNVRLPLVPKQIDSIGYRRKAATTRSLAASSVAADKAEFQWRISTGVSTVLLALLGIPLGLTVPRQGKSARVLMAVIIFALYYNLVVVAKTWMEQGLVGSFPGVWWPHVMLAILLAVSMKPSGWSLR